jgi:multimeric flavodoxin WrbA
LDNIGKQKMKDQKLPREIHRISGAKSSESFQDSRGKRIIGISGSPRRGGNTDLLLDKALEGARGKRAKTKKFILNELKFSPCQECKNIRKDGVCIVNDGLQPVYKEIEKADGIILASPIFFGSVSAQTKMMIDRFQCLWLAKNIFKTYKSKKRKVGAFICVEASTRKDFFENASSIVKNFFATIDAVYKEELLCSGIDKKGAIKEKSECLKAAFKIGEKVSTIKTSDMGKG